MKLGRSKPSEPAKIINIAAIGYDALTENGVPFDARSHTSREFTFTLMRYAKSKIVEHYGVDTGLFGSGADEARIASEIAEYHQLGPHAANQKARAVCSAMDDEIERLLGTNRGR